MTDLIYRELDGYNIPVTREMLYEYFKGPEELVGKTCDLHRYHESASQKDDGDRFLRYADLSNTV